MFRRIVFSNLKTLISSSTSSAISKPSSFLLTTRLAAATATATAVIPRLFSTDSSVPKTTPKVEDVQPIATGHEREELQAELTAVIPRLISTDSSVPKTTPKVEDVQPIATGHEREELQAELTVVIPCLISTDFSVPKTTPNVQPIATGHEREELQAELEGRDILEINHPVGPFGTKEAPAIVKSYYDRRIVGCPGGEGEDEHDAIWFWLKKDQPYECPVCTQYFMLEVVGPGGDPEGHSDDEGEHHH